MRNPGSEQRQSSVRSESGYPVYSNLEGVFNTGKILSEENQLCQVMASEMTQQVKVLASKLMT